MSGCSSDALARRLNAAAGQSGRLSVDFTSGWVYTPAKSCLAEMGMNYQFDTDKISQHVVKYGVDMRPAVLPDQDRARLQDYGNWLVAQFPEVFETMLVGPRELRVQRTFLLPNAKRVELPTFVLTGRGPVFTFPERLYIDRPHELAIPDKDKIFSKAFNEMRTRFPERTVPQVGVVHEFVFDTEFTDSLEVVASSLKHETWRDRIKNLRLFLEMPTDDKNVNIELRPPHVQRAGPFSPTSPEGMKFGIIVNVDINNRQTGGSLTASQVADILAFANDFVPDELIRFLNNEE